MNYPKLVQKLNKDLYFAIIDAFEMQIAEFEKRKRLSVGCAIHCTDKEERELHLKGANEAGKWALEAYNYNKEFVDTFEPIID